MSLVVVHKSLYTTAKQVVRLPTGQLHHAAHGCLHAVLARWLAKQTVMTGCRSARLWCSVHINSPARMYLLLYYCYVFYELFPVAAGHVLQARSLRICTAQPVFVHHGGVSRTTNTV